MGTSSYTAVQLEFGVRNIQAIAANFFRADVAAQEAARGAVERFGHHVHDLAYLLCAKRTHFMANHIRERYTPSGLGVEVGWDAADFMDAGLAFYPWFVELGTMHMGAQPALLPAYDAEIPDFQRDLGTVLSEATARSIAGTL